jgi:heme A synthase
MSRLAKLAWGVLALNVAVILWGAYVRATGSGAGCGGHWPTCNGEVLPRAPGAATLIELSHRASSGVAFGAVMLLGVLVWRATPPGHPARRPAVLGMALMLCEVLVGAAIVLLGHVALDPSLAHGAFTEVHACNTFLLLAALTLTAHHLSGCPEPRLAGRGPLVISLAQSFVGFAFTALSGAIAALGDTLFPTHSLGEGLAQDFSPGAHLFLQLRTLHPVFAMLAFFFVFGGCTSLRARTGLSPESRALSFWVLVTICLQVALGGLNLLLLAPIPMQMLHLLAADVLFILLVMLSARALSDPRSEPVAPLASATA